MEETVAVDPIAITFLLVLMAGALLCARLITRMERDLVTSAAFILAGAFFVARSVDEPAASLVGAMLWIGGLCRFIWIGLGWGSGSSSRAGPLAVLFLLPPAFFGAVLIGGIATGLLAL